MSIITVNYSLLLDRYKNDIGDLYEIAMTNLSSRHSQREIDTFPEKVAAALSHTSGSPSSDDTYFLAKIDGVVNGLTPLNSAQRASEVSGINAAELLIVDARAEKILKARNRFRFYTAKIEQVRDKHLDQLVDGDDNQPIVDSLAATFAAAF